MGNINYASALGSFGSVISGNPNVQGLPALNPEDRPFGFFAGSPAAIGSSDLGLTGKKLCENRSIFCQFPWRFHKISAVNLAPTPERRVSGIRRQIGTLFAGIWPGDPRESHQQTSAAPYGPAIGMVQQSMSINHNRRHSIKPERDTDTDTKSRGK